MYPLRFDWVLPFHEPGLAPVGTIEGAFHIKSDGSPAYEAHFSRTFGFYQGLAAVVMDDDWYHILSKGTPAYELRWSWCGNFQNDRCPVRDNEGNYYHIKLNGSIVPHGPWAYAGDYREGAAVVRGEEGLCRHVDCEGNLIHEGAFFDLAGWSLEHTQEFKGHAIFMLRLVR